MTANLDVVVDMETTIRCPVGNNKGSPHWPHNHVVALGQYHGGTPHMLYDKTGVKVPHVLFDNYLIVGHNLAFDFQWLLRLDGDPDTVLLRASKATLWDTQLAEYVLSGQEARMISLDELSVKYGLPVKDDRIKTMWDAGVDTDAIPETMLTDYCRQDVTNTHAIYQRQIEQAQKQGQLKLLMMLNGALLATILMQWNGMNVDRSVLERAATSAEFALTQTEDSLHEYLSCNCFNLGSPAQVSAALFGGEIKETVKEADGVYKSGLRKGEVKYRNKQVVHTLARQINPEKVGATKGKSGYWSTDDAVLEKIVAHRSTTGADIATLILWYRKLDKQLNTYYKPILELLFPGDIIHHNINATVTKTGRYSSSNPNLQNVTAGEDSEVKKAFVSRWGEDGVIVEADFKQLEIVALAELSGDPQLRKDVLNGVDIHTELFKQVYHKAPTYEERRQFKRAVFASVYGAGANRISELTGMSFHDSKEFLRAFDRRYPQIAVYRSVTDSRVIRNRQPSERRGPTGIPLGRSQIQQATGRILTFYEYEPDGKWKKSPYFSWNDICNYPIQSFATGDLVPLFLDKLSRTIYAKELFQGSVVLVNTVHDSVVLDCKKEVVEVLKNVIIDVAGNMKLYAKEDLGIELSLPLNVEVSSGPNWAEQKE